MSIVAARVVEVIRTEASRGKGTDDDRCRIVVQYWGLDGELLAEFDPCPADKASVGS